MNHQCYDALLTKSPVIRKKFRQEMIDDYYKMVIIL